jgi:hypothetical protein
MSSCVSPLIKVIDYILCYKLYFWTNTLGAKAFSAELGAKAHGADLSTKVYDTKLKALAPRVVPHLRHASATLKRA